MIGALIGIALMIVLNGAMALEAYRHNGKFDKEGK